MRRIVAIGIFVTLFGCSLDTVTSRYATLEEARADRLFERGWLPEVLPPSTTRIRTENQLDLNLSEGEFSFEPSEANVLFNKLSGGAPLASRLDGWEETVNSYTRRGYSAWSYRDEDSTWAFFCQGPKGYCEYIMWLR
jgi:hypothetical protein